MKKIIASTLAALSLTTTAAVASEPVNVFAHADKLKFSGLTYIGYKYNDYKDDSDTVDYRDDTSQFEIRRAYLQVKAYLLDDPKSYYRVTFDVHQDTKQDGLEGSMVVRVKYAYLYLNDVLPATGIEMGIAHRPWHDYEEHNSWYFRNSSKVLVEQGNGAHLSNSADFGILSKTKTKYFDLDAGIFNGEGYHAVQLEKGMSFEWRATAHILGVNGKDKQNTKTYWDASFFGQYNKEHKDVTVGTTTRYDDLVFGGLHTVFNMPSFLIAAQYVQSLDTADADTYTSAQAGAGYSVNGEYRLGNEKQYRLLGRYDSWTPETFQGLGDKEQKTYIAGFAWDQFSNVEWVANVEMTDNEKGSSRENRNGLAYMITTQVSF